MMQAGLWLLSVLAVFFLGAGPLRAEQRALQSPDVYFGHPMGADRKLVSYDEALPYLRHLAEQSRYVEIHNAGITLENRDLVYLVISSPANLAQEDRYKTISSHLHHPQGLTPQELEHLVDEGKTILMVTANMHSDEIIGSQTTLEWAYRLASHQYPNSKPYLNDVIVLLFPSINPDGQVLATEWYRDQLGTEYEGASMPWLYHRYAGHAINRDWFMLNLPESKAVNRVAFHDWFPQVLVDVHQMSLTGPRLFVPPYADPISNQVHPLIYRGAALFGANMALQLEQAGKKGVISGYYFDAYWPGGLRSTPWWKNTVGVLVEAASCRFASPVYVEPNDLEGGQKGLVDYQPQVNFPNPWPGGWWRPLDILEYELIALDSALETAAVRRRDLLADRVIMSQAAVHAPNDGVFAYVISRESQRDGGSAKHLVEVLVENGVDAFETRTDEKQGIPSGSIYVPASQPLRPFLREMMEPQSYREVRPGLGSRDFLRPYDVTAWTLPLLMGVTVRTLDSPLSTSVRRLREVNWETTWPDTVREKRWWSLSPQENDSYTAVWRLLESGEPVYQATATSRGHAMSQPAGTFWVQTTRESMEDAVGGLLLSHITAAEEADSRTWRRLRLPRVGIYTPWNPTPDTGWLRFVLEQFHIPYTPLDRLAFDDRLRAAFDVILLPNMGVEALVNGHAAFNGDQQDPRPSPYNGGLGRKGVEALRQFVHAGGTLAALGESSHLALAEFNIPVHTLPALAEHPDTPGVLLETFFDARHPLAYGMPDQGVVFHTQSPVLVAERADPGDSLSVVARFPREPKAVSGWASDLDLLSRRAALVEAQEGAGRVVLFGFLPFFRGQTTCTYKLLFNTLLHASAEKLPHQGGAAPGSAGASGGDRN